MAAADSFSGSSPWQHEFIWPESVQEISKKDPLSVPDKYVRPAEERPPLELLSGDIPVLDMAAITSADSSTRVSELQRLAKACEEWGFFQITNHGIPADLIDRIRQVSYEFFQLPLAEKQKYKPRPGDAQGYGKTFVVDDEQKLDWGDVIALFVLPEHQRDLSRWPSPPSDFRETVERYGREVERVAKNVLRAIAETLELQANYFEEKFGKDPVMTMRMNLYPICPRPDLVLGLSPHADGSGITLVLQDDHCEGLHVRHASSWVPVRPIPYALVVNIGDLLEAMTNGRYMSVEHRAVPNSSSPRQSIAMFYSTATEAEVKPAEKLVREDGTCFYRSFLHKEYIRHYLSHRLDGKRVLHDFARLK